MAQYELNLHDYWRIIKKRRWIILLTAVAVIASVVVFTNLQTPLYQATATVKVEPSMVIPGVATSDAGWDTYTALNTEVKILRSSVIAERTARKMGLINDRMSAEQIDRIAASLGTKINPERVGETNLITVAASSSDPDETAKLANSVAEVYIEKGMEDRSRRSRDLRQFIETQLSDAEAKLKVSEDALRDYTAKSGAKGIGGYLSTRLTDLQVRKSDLLKKYTNAHPEVERLSQQIRTVEEQMKTLPAEELEYARLSREVKINEELYTLLAKRYKEAQISEADRVQSAFIVTPAMKPSSPIKPNRTMNIAVGVFIGIFLGFLFAIIVENLDTSIGTIEDVEKYLGVPVLGIVPHIEPEIRDRKSLFSFKEQGSKAESARSKLIIYQTMKSPFVEAYHTLRTNLAFAVPRTGTGKVIAFSSAGIGEGKTLTASNFAIAAAQSGIKTLLVETDLRLPAVHRIFGIKRDPGFSDCLIGTRKWTDVMRGTTDFLMSAVSMDKILQSPGIENLRVITSGPIPPNPVDLFNSLELKKIFSEMTRQFELVVLDCPPILLFADALITGTNTSGVIIVYRVGKMARGALKRAKDQLTNVKIPVLGVIVNDITASDMEPHYGYYYSSRYYSKNPESPSS
jgi:tyrosine-protein kinase Etk/Wzc